jgi:hypothetical protein
MGWNSRRHFRARMAFWRQALCTKFPTDSRILRLAWCLAGLFEARGYAFPSDGFLASQSVTPAKKVTDGLKAMEDAGAIIRVHVFKKGQLQRRIFPAVGILSVLSPTLGDAVLSDLSPTAGDTGVKVPIPHGGANLSPTAGGQNKKEFRGQFSSTQNAALRDAERRAAREANRGSDDEFEKRRAPR